MNNIDNLLNIIGMLYNRKHNNLIINRFLASNDKTRLVFIAFSFLGVNEYEPHYMLKLYDDKSINLSNNEVNIYNLIKQNITPDFKYVKIPKLTEYGKLDGNNYHIYDRVYHLENTDIKKPTNIDNINAIQLSDLGNAISNPHNIFDKLRAAFKNFDMGQCMYELGQMFGYLNFKVNVIPNGIRIIFGKDNLSSTDFKLYMCNFEKAEYVNDITTIDSNKKILGDPDYFNLSSLKDDNMYKMEFIKGYLDMASDHTEFAKNRLGYIKYNGPSE
jgi:hypothetical protein